MFASALVVPACGSGPGVESGTNPDASQPFEQVEWQGRAIAIVSSGEDFVAFQLGGTEGRVQSARYGPDGWNAPMTLPFEQVRNVDAAADSEGRVFALAPSCDFEIDECVVGSPSVAISMMTDDSDEWAPPVRLDGASSPALASSSDFQVALVGAGPQGLVFVVAGDDSGSLELWRMVDGELQLLPSPPVRTMSFCMSGDGAVWGLEHRIVTAGSVVPGDVVSDRLVEGEPRFFALEADEWTSMPYQTPAAHPLDSGTLICDEDGPLSMWPAEMIDGLTLDRIPIDVLDGTFQTQRIPGPGVLVLRSARQGLERVFQLGVIDSDGITFQPIDGPVSAAAVNNQGTALVAGTEAGHDDIEWHLIPNALPG